jgi:tRNA (mo5U34)-methyltransferase
MPITAIDINWFERKAALFAREFNAEGLRELAARETEHLCQPERLLTFAEVMREYPYYDRLLVEHPLVSAIVDRYLDQVTPYCQSPFPLPDQRVIQGLWMGDYKVQYLFPRTEVTPQFIGNKRVLDIGCNAGFDTFLLAAMGAGEVIGIEPTAFFHQAHFLWTVYYCPTVRFLKSRWQDLSPASIGTFDVINCQGVIYHEPAPTLLLEKLFSLLAPVGTLILETHITLEQGLNARLIEDTFWQDSTWWWVPSVPTVIALLRKCGYSDVQVRTQNPVPSRNPSDPERTVEGIPVGGRACLTAIRPR